MNPTTGTWDETLVRDIFCVQDTTLILSIPLFEDMIDEWAWHFDEKGLFSVKSAYHLQRQLTEVQLGQEESSDPSRGFKWEEIWKAECTPNVRQFLWRFAHNSLPCRFNLQRRGMQIDTICPSCNRLDEDGCHLFLKCKVAKNLWRTFGLEKIRTDLIECDGPQHVLTHIFKLRRDLQILIFALLWWRWIDRNKVVAGENGNSEISLTHLIRHTVNDFDQFCTKELAKKPKPQIWSTPTGDELKLNTDGSFFPDTHTGGWGFIVRDSDGVPVGAGAGPIQYVHDALHSEAAACLAGLQWSQSWGISKIQVETDSQRLVEAITTNIHDLSVNGHLFREIKFLTSLNFSSFSIKYCPRACNKVADAMATYGAKLGHQSQAVWPDGAPEFVHGLVDSDRAGSTC
jgi:ribonuclease HI